MPIYIGDKEIATVFKGNTELDNIRLGDQQQWIGIIVTPDPSLSIQSLTTDTITYRFTNNHDEEVTITYELNNPNPAANTIVVPANSFVDETLVGLNQNTEYTLYATALEFEQIPSNVVSVTGTTVQATTANPIISSLSTSSGTSSTSVSFQVQNEDSENVTLYYELNDTSPDLYNTTIVGNSSVGLNIDSLSPSTNYTLYVYAIADGYIASDVISQSFTTPQLRTETPSIVVTSETHTSVNFRITNNDSSTATIKYDINDGTPDAVTITLGAGQSSNRSWSGLTDGTGYTIYATAQASGETLSSVGSRSFTTDRYTTASPTISIVGTTNNSINYRVTNNDNNTVTLKYEINDSTPDRTSYNVAPGASITYNRTGLSTGQTYTIYARAYAPRENSSPTVSLQATAVTPPNIFYTTRISDETARVDNDLNPIWRVRRNSADVYGCAIGPGEYVYTASLDDTIKKLDPNGNQIWSYGFEGDVWGVSVDSNSNVYAGGGNNVGSRYLRKFDSNGNVIWQTFGANPKWYDTAVDRSFNVYGAGSSTMYKFNSSGSPVWSYGVASQIKRIRVDASGNVYATTDYNSDSIYKVNSSGNLVWINTSHTNNVNGLAVGTDGSVYSASQDATFRKINSSGNQVWQYPAGGYGQSMAVDYSNTVYAGSGYQNDTLFKISSNGSLITSVGIGRDVVGLAVSNPLPL